MHNPMLQHWTDMNKNTLSVLKALGEINAAAITRLNQRQMDMINLYVESGAKQLEVLSESHNVQDVLTAQSRLVSEMNDKLIKNARDTVEVLVDTKSDFSSWVEKGIESTTTTVTLPHKK